MRARALGLALAFVAAAPPAARAPEAELPPVVGAPRAVAIADGDTLLDVAVRAGVGFDPLIALNPGIDVWIPEPGTRIALPTEYVLPDAPREGLVINLPEMRLYDFGADDPPAVFAIAIGDPTARSPVGDYRVGNKRLDPYWYVPDSIREEHPDLPGVVAPGPENPLGDRWITVAGSANYGIHGTNQIWSIGRTSTHGCIRLYNEDMRTLYARTRIGTRLRFTYQTLKLGQRGGWVYLESHADVYGLDPGAAPKLLVRLIALDALGVVDGRSIDEEQVRVVIETARGVPVRIGRLRAARAADRETP